MNIVYSFGGKMLGWLSCVSSLLLLNVKVLSQKEANNWYFGLNAGITFNGSTVMPLTNGKVNTLEGCATISDKNGNLLFYTDGLNVWDNTHTITPNGSGLKGHPSSTQSAIIVPKPGSVVRYYIFTVDESANTNGLQYSEFDLTLNSGKGDIVASQKNIKLLGSTCEKLTGVGHSNGNDFWVLSHLFNSDVIYAWSISASGVNNTPVKSSTGLTVGSPIENTLGYMKVSPEGTKIAYANDVLGVCGIGDFNSATGVVSNVWKFSMNIAYGLEFSSSGKYLYVAEKTNSTIYQFRANANTLPEFIASKIRIENSNPTRGEIGAMQIGPDRRIYISRHRAKSLDVIHFPDSAGFKCNIQYDYVDLSGKQATYGLPTFIQSYFNPVYSHTGNCYGDTSWFWIADASATDSVRWNFGDPKSGNRNSVKGFRVFHLFSDTGVFKVRAISYKSNVKDTTYLKVNQKIAVLDLGSDTVVCDKQPVTLGYSLGSYSEYTWSDKSTGSTLVANSGGLYWLRIRDNKGCYRSDTIRVSYFPLPAPQLGPDFTFCDTAGSVSRSIKVKTNEETWEWSTGSMDTVETLLAPGVYWVRVKNGCGETLDTIHIKVDKSPQVDLGRDTMLCGHFNYLLDAGNPGLSYKWSPTGETSRWIFADIQTIYKVVVASVDGCLGKDSMTVLGGCISHFWFPNSFTPTDDKLNETFKPSLTNCENYVMRIFDRWGEKIFETMDIGNGWDGWYHGKLCQAGIYFFVSEFVTTENNMRRMVRGTITLLK